MYHDAPEDELLVNVRVQKVARGILGFGGCDTIASVMRWVDRLTRRGHGKTKRNKTNQLLRSSAGNESVECSHARTAT